ncbi:deoxyribodipyrimidine photo-lyase [Exiguobacterium sp. SL-9]|uniref:cryptochrome/photolyase family protein n=1 Tax=Exiguobacterium sp. SL-9 TaxID=2510963 RepID=UPI00103A1545|nr:deoxyribodipyrimidine photo-lyase [Exiguobacterium sp. SL-9]TCI23311.1 deoxyribodipyrimidine photo-lyase [Exiguobacterium sp. SL-9]
MRRVCWFRSDFRLTDHHMLHRVLKDADSSDDVEFVFWLNPKYCEPFETRHDYFFATMRQFMDELKENGLGLRVLVADTAEQFVESLGELDALYFNAEYVEPFKQRDDAVIEALGQDVKVIRLLDRHLFAPNAFTKKDGDPYKVYTPFKKAAYAEAPPAPYEVDIEMLKQLVTTDNVVPIELQHQFDRCERSWKALGEAAAKRRLHDFVNNRIDAYDVDRDIPAIAGTSRLSPYLRTGVLSIRTVAEAVRSAPKSSGRDTYYDELLWREFYYMIMVQFPGLKDRPFNDKYKHLDWENDEENFKAWCDGKTGYPIVDAAMRQLNETGWMHNRLRMIVASFLSKHLMIDWRKGERYFEQKLIDYEAASNIGGWQWAASVGTDAVPYFRIFNPTTQSEKFDRDGTFIRKYVPELADLDKKAIHFPGLAERDGYVDPIVDHKEARARALERFKQAQ